MAWRSEYAKWLDIGRLTRDVFCDFSAPGKFKLLALINNQVNYRS
jgi:hypothetical protein